MKTQYSLLLLTLLLLGIFVLSYSYFTVLGSGGTFIFTRSDLTLSQLSFSPPQASTLDPVTIKVTLRNVGNDIARNLVVEFTDSTGNLLIGTHKVESLAPNDFVDIEVPWFPKFFGSHVINVFADSQNSVNELDENNNQATEIYRI